MFTRFMIRINTLSPCLCTEINPSALCTEDRPCTSVLFVFTKNRDLKTTSVFSCFPTCSLTESFLLHRLKNQTVDISLHINEPQVLPNSLFLANFTFLKHFLLNSATKCEKKVQRTKKVGG